MPIREEEARLQEAVRDLLARFHTVLRTAKVYEPSNRLLQEQVGPLFRSLALVIQAQGGAVLRLHGGSLFFNRIKIRSDASNRGVLASLAAELEARGAAAAAFSDGVTLEELTRFVVLLAGREAGAVIPFEAAAAKLKEAGIVHVALEARGPSADQMGAEARRIRAYFLGIRLLRDIMEGQRRRTGFSLGLARRWMQAMIRHLEEDESFCLGLAAMKNAETYHANHGVNVAVYAAALGRRLNLPRRDQVELGVSALLHDLGTLEVSSAILDKPARLNEEERAALDKQSRLGAQRMIPALAGRALPVKALEVAMEHRREIAAAGRAGGAGRGPIHLFSRIVRIADAYDALTSKRVYRPLPHTPAEALRLMAEKSGRDFDPLLLRAFAAMLGPYPVGSLVLLQGGEIGVVMAVRRQPELAARPRIKLITDAGGRRIDGPVVDLAAPQPAGLPARTIALALNAYLYGVRTADYFLVKGH